MPRTAYSIPAEPTPSEPGDPAQAGVESMSGGVGGQRWESDDKKKPMWSKLEEDTSLTYGGGTRYRNLPTPLNAGTPVSVVPAWPFAWSWPVLPPFAARPPGGPGGLRCRCGLRSLHPRQSPCRTRGLPAWYWCRTDRRRWMLCSRGSDLRPSTGPRQADRCCCL